MIQPHPWPCPAAEKPALLSEAATTDSRGAREEAKSLDYLSFFMPGNRASTSLEGSYRFHLSLVFRALETKLFCLTIAPLGLKLPHGLLPPSPGEVLHSCSGGPYGGRPGGLGFSYMVQSQQGQQHSQLNKS